jgi:Kef-type K+ transport system membrane component KefB
MLDWLSPLTPPTELTNSALVAYALLDVFLIIVLGRILGTVMVKIQQPRVVGEILAGVLLGPTLLGQNLSLALAPQPVRPILSVIATIGLVLFMFLAGIEFDASRIKGRARQAGSLAVLSVAIPALLGFPVAALMHTPAYYGPAGEDLLPFALFIGAALSVTAFPVMAHILMERGQLNSKMGSLAVAATGKMSILMFTYIAFAAAVVAAKGFSDLLLKVFFMIVFGVISWFFIRPLLRRWLPEQEAITGNAMALIFSGMVLYGLIAHLIGINALVGGFVWGLILPAGLTFRKAVAAKVNDVALILLLPVFFALAGFSTNLKLLTLDTLPVVALVLAAAIAGKFAGALPARAFGLTWNEVGILGALFNTRGLLVLVAGLIGLQLGIITNLTFTITVVVALVTNLMTLPLLNWFSLQEKAALIPLAQPEA